MSSVHGARTPDSKPPFITALLGVEGKPTQDELLDSIAEYVLDADPVVELIILLGNELYSEELALSTALGRSEDDKGSELVEEPDDW